MLNKTKRELKEFGGLYSRSKDMNSFKNHYVSFLKNKPRRFDYYGWEAVADEIFSDIGNSGAEIGDFIDIEISQFYTASGNPELVHCGQVVKTPVIDPETGDGIGSYVLEF